MAATRQAGATRDVLPQYSMLPSLVGVVSSGIASVGSATFALKNRSKVIETTADKTILGLNVIGNVLDMSCKVAQMIQISSANNANSNRRR